MNRGTQTGGEDTMSEPMTREQAIKEVVRYLPAPYTCNCGAREGEDRHYGMTMRTHGWLTPEQEAENARLAAIRAALA